MDSGLHFFDVDHTVTKHSTGLNFLYQGIKMGLLPIAPLVTAPLLYWRYRLGMMDLREVDQVIPSLRGLTRNQLEEIAERCFEERIKSDIYSTAECQIREITAGGGEVVFATLSVDLIIEPLARYLGVRDVVASSFEFAGGTASGRFDGGPILNQEKCDQVLRYIERSGHRPLECSFYSDSINDLPLLESVGRPVVVNPDRRLSRIASQRGWQICRWK